MLYRPIVVLFVGFLIFPVALADRCPTAEQKALERQKTSTPQPGNANRLAYIDPKTGELATGRPPGVPALQTDSAQLRQARRDAEVITHPDGMISVDISGLYLSMLEAEIIDGKLVVCHVDPAEVKQR